MNTETFQYVGEKFADIQMLRYKLKGFASLSAQQKAYIYYLSKATLSGRDITTDQYGRYNLDIRKMFEAVLVYGNAKTATEEYAQMEVYLKRLWFSNGIHHHYGCEKFAPGFTEKWLRDTVNAISPDLLPQAKYGGVTQMLDVLCPIIFNPETHAKRVNQNDGEDLVATSACNLYDGVTQQEAEKYYEAKRAPNCGDRQPSWGLNSRLVKKGDGSITEQKYTTDGLYGAAIKEIVHWLEKAAEVAENEQQRKVIKLLTDYYKSGDLHVFDLYNIEWLKEQHGDIDFINGFIEVYGDPLGLKGTWEGIVEYRDWDATRRTQTIASNAQWFEDNSPTDPRFKKAKVKGVTAHVVRAAMLGGEEYPSTAIGINLPNADWIRAQYGSKSVTIGNLTEAYNKAAHGNGFNEEFVIDADTLALIEKHGDICDDLHTDLHECLGHGSGQLLPGVSPDALKAYSSTNEEARADLFGLYYLADPKLVELGLLPDGEAYKSQYYHYIMNGLLTQLVRIKPGHQIEEAHMRNRALIAHWCLKNGNGTVELVKRDGKTYVRINDYPALRNLFGTLLSEVQRIKSEGDYEGARNLVETYAVKVDPDIHDEILQRYSKLGIAPYKGFLNPWMIPTTDNEGNITDIKLDYSETYTQQMLRYSREYGFL